jgi:hypothetical protein
MTLQDIGSIGELIAAIATVATLVYLAAQIRQNTRSTRASSFQATSSYVFDIFDQVALSGEMSRIYFAGTRDFESLSTEDRRRFGTYMSSLLGRWENLVFQGEQGFLDPMAFPFLYENIRIAFAQPGTRQWWARAEHLFPSSLRRIVARDFIRKDSGPAAQQGAAADEPQHVPIALR